MNLDHEHDSSVDIDEEMDESQMRGRGFCRGCKEMKNDILADNGYCGDCD